ncbi:hypothetical protein ACHWQZ_G016392 [Mnemiopsis leidyi]
MKVAIVICLVVVSSAVDIKIVSYGTGQGPEPCARICYGTTAGTNEKEWTHIKGGSALDISLADCKFTSPPIIIAKTVISDQLIPTDNYQDTLAKVQNGSFQYVMYGVASSYATLLDFRVSWSATGYTC